MENRQPTRCTVAVAAQKLGVSVDTVRRRIRAGEIEGLRDQRGQWWLDIPARSGDGVVGDMPGHTAPELLMGHASVDSFQSSEDRLIHSLNEEVAFLRSRVESLEEDLRQERQNSRVERQSILSLVERISGIDK